MNRKSIALLEEREEKSPTFTLLLIKIEIFFKLFNYF